MIFESLKEKTGQVHVLKVQYYSIIKMLKEGIIVGHS